MSRKDGNTFRFSVGISGPSQRVRRPTGVKYFLKLNSTFYQLFVNFFQPLSSIFVVGVTFGLCFVCSFVVFFGWFSTKKLKYGKQG